MRIPRIYQPIPLQEGLAIPLNQFAVHHVIDVLRLNINDPLVIFNGEGGEFSAVISRISKKEVSVTIKKFQNIDRESSLKIHLGQAVSRGEKMDFTIQKSIELGVNTITPLITERCNVKLSDERWQKRMEHWRRIIINACEQCGCNRIPMLLPVEVYNVWVKKMSAPLKLVLDAHSENTLRTFKGPEKEIVLLIGSEGGFSEKEIQLAKKQGFQGLRLGQRILRTETAALAAISALQTKWGDFL